MKKSEIKHTALILSLFAGVSALSLMLLTTACDTESANSVSRTVNVDVAGLYRYDDEECLGQGRFVSANSGNEVVSLDVRQTGDQLEAVDNNGILFRGTIGYAVDGLASFTLSGSTTAGNAVTISGTIEVGGGTGIMRATWIEETQFGTVCGSADGPVEIIDDDDDGTTTNESGGLLFIQ